ncbi:uncharacterized mitochondrial protein AtMg00820-like [Arachis hypogaea]|uniref:uncharacterized mitochondrial protein AtMg00820-like n=1 Tax=Arachis hypogaea TaxID=3818 RepID=UPI000DED374F|nr:uncharacterized protein LOC112803851 [Arachis hypogaea]
MATRSQTGIFNPKALTSSQWKAAIDEEYASLMKCKTWKLVDPSTAANPITCRWVFRIKRQPDRSIQKYKARLVTKGFHQRKGVNYGEVFSLVAKPMTVCVVMAVALSR